MPYVMGSPDRTERQAVGGAQEVAATTTFGLSDSHGEAMHTCPYGVYGIRGGMKGKSSDERRMHRELEVRTASASGEPTFATAARQPLTSGVPETSAPHLTWRVDLHSIKYAARRADQYHQMCRRYT